MTATLSRYDQDLSMPDIVEVMADFDAAGGEAEAIAWLAENDIGATPVTVKLVHVDSRYAYSILGCSFSASDPVFFITPGEPNCLAFPVLKDGDAIDLMLIDLQDMRYYTVLQEAEWLGYDNLDADVVRLHFSPLEWLGAGCAGVVQIHDYQRGHMTALRRAKRIECNDVALALEAWEWGFSAHDEDLGRFDVDDDAENIRAYFERQAMWSARALSRAAR